jgi:ATP-dependent Lon protease
MHYLRDELSYRAVVDQLLQLPKNSATRDTEAIKRICTGYLKLLFPDATDVSKVNIPLFETYCLAPAMEMRRVIKTQLGIIDEGEFGGTTIPDITIKEQYRESQEV